MENQGKTSVGIARGIAHQALAISLHGALLKFSLMGAYWFRLNV